MSNELLADAKENADLVNYPITDTWDAMTAQCLKEMGIEKP